MTWCKMTHTCFGTVAGTLVLPICFMNLLFPKREMRQNDKLDRGATYYIQYSLLRKSYVLSH